VFALETLSLFDERLQLSLGGSRVRAETSSHNRLTNVGTPELSLTEELLQYGVVYKPVAGVSVFYGYNENFAPNFLSGQVLPSQLGEQTEVGVKLDLLDGRLSANVAYFDIQQQNVPVLSFPQTTPPSFVLVPGQTSKGVDADIAYKFSDNLDVVFTFALLDAEARSQANSAAPVIVNPVNNVAETTFGLWTRYKFDEGILDGLSIGVGLSYLDERAVTNNNNSIVYGWLDDFLLADLVLSYERGRVRYGVNIDNLFGTGYEAAVRNQSIIVPGMGRNWKASVTWKF
jgi:iron complex outermembrane receptor protein